MPVESTAQAPSAAEPLPRGPEVLIATAPAGRLNPPPAGTYLARPRLHDALTAAVAAAPLTVVTGPTGSGKTVLAAGWAQTRARDGLPVAWLSLGPIANGSPPAFWASALAALRRAGVPLDGLGTPVRDQRLPPAFAVRLGARLVDLPDPVVLVVDHADALSHPRTLEALDLLGAAASSRLRMVLLARADPLLPLGRQRASGRPAELRAADLVFRPDEVAALLNRLGAPVAASEAAALASATGGWAVTVPLLAALLCRGRRPDELARDITDSDGVPLEYLLGEVLQRLPGDMRSVLLRAGVADELWPGLVTPLTGRYEGLRILDWLTAGHAGVERVAGAPGGLRIPAVIREHLAAELAFSDPDGYVAAYRAAADWYSAGARLPQPVAYAVGGGNWEGAARMLVADLAVAALLARAAAPEADLLDAARPQLRGPDAALLRAAAAVGRTGRASPADLAVVRLLAADAGRPGPRDGDRAGDPPERQASALLVLATAALGTGGSPDRALAAIDAAQARTAALVTVRPERRAECAALLTTARASALLATDASDAVLRDAARTALDTCAAAGTERLRAGRLADLALLQALAGRLGEADALATEYRALADEWDVPRPLRSPTAALAEAWVCAARGQAAESRRWARHAQESAVHRRGVHTTPLLAVLESRRLRLAGRLDAATRALGPAPAAALPRWVREQVIDEQVRLRLARGERDALRPLDALPLHSLRAAALRATAVLSGLATGPDPEPATADAGLPPVVVLAAEVARAALLAADGSTAAAVAVLCDALRAAEPDRLRLPFLDAPPPARRLLDTHPDLAAARGWLSTTGRPRPARPATRSGTGAPLSVREREALAHLAAGLSSAGIAAAMDITTNTARGHLRSVLRKLAAADRADAVRRAGDPRPVRGVR